MSIEALANWNGQEMPLSEVRVSVLDRAFLFGDAVYEAIRVYGGRPWLCRQHIERLARSVAAVRIRCDVARLEERMHQTLQHSSVREGLIYIQVTRGVAPRTHHFPRTEVTPNELIVASDLGLDPHAHHRQAGVRAITQPDLRWARRDIKSVNLLANCLASQAAVEHGCYEAILIEPDGAISEGTHTSIFGVADGHLLTAPTGPHILSGITRELVLRLAGKAQVPHLESAVRKNDLPRIDELFLTGTTTEVLPIVAVDGQPIAGGVPGPITRLLADTYRAAVEEWLRTGAEEGPLAKRI